MGEGKNYLAGQSCFIQKIVMNVGNPFIFASVKGPNYEH